MLVDANVQVLIYLSCIVDRIDRWNRIGIASPGTVAGVDIVAVAAYDRVTRIEVGRRSWVQRQVSESCSAAHL